MPNFGFLILIYGCYLSQHYSLLSDWISELRDEEIQKDRMRFRRNMERIGEVRHLKSAKPFRSQKGNPNSTGHRGQQNFEGTTGSCNHIKSRASAPPGFAQLF